ncbi:protein Njmu-R1-like isoform X1 [Argonauta hians]
MVDTSGNLSDSPYDNIPPTQIQRQHFYALYTFHSSRSKHRKCQEKNEATLEDQGRGDDDIEELSLSIVATDLNAGIEIELRKCLIQRLSKGVDCIGSGNVVSLTSSENSDFPSVCYYCLWKSDSNPACKSTPVLPPSPKSRTTSTGDYLVCFLFCQEDSLEHFRIDLDDYSGGVLQYLDAEITKMTDKNGKLSQIDTCVKEYLEAWPVVAMDYLCRCIDVLHDSIHNLIYCALLGIQLEIIGGSEQLKKDIQNFIRSCTLDGISNLQNSCNMSSSGDSWQTLDVPPVLHTGTAKTNLPSKGDKENSKTICLTILDQGKSFKFEPDESCRFCKDWADKLINTDRHNALYLKVTIDSYKLQCIQDINTLNRFLKLAENDHYALYRAYLFLKYSGYTNILLKYCQLLDLKSDDKDALAVLKEFIQETE